MDSDVGTIRESVLDILRHGPLADRFGEVDVEPASYDDFEFLRILVHTRQKASDADLLAALQSIHEDIATRYRRYASVRFPDAD